MSDGTDNDMTGGRRRVHRRFTGPKPIAALVATAARQAYAKGAPGVGRMLEAWPAIMGEQLASVTVPRRLTRGTLTIGCSGPVALELQHLTNPILGKINGYLGTQTVHRLRFAQDQVTPRTIGRRLPPKADPAQERAVSQSVAALPDGPLKDALAALGRAVLTETGHGPA